MVSTIPAAAQDADLVGAARSVPVRLRRRLRPVADAAGRAAERAGRVLVSGLDLLAHQAALQVELMTGRPAPLERDARRLGEAALAADGPDALH